MQKHWRVLALGAVVSGIVIALIAGQIDFPLLWEALRTANYFWLIPASLLTALGLLTRALRWRVLLGGGLGLARAFHILNIAYLLNGVLPMRLGEVGRVWLASRGADGVPMFRSASTVVVERLLDLLAVAVFVALGLVVGPMPDALRTTGLVAGAAALGGFVFLIVLAGRRALALKVLARILPRLPVLRGEVISTRVMATVAHLLDGLQPITRPASLLGALWWTAASWAISLLTGLVMMLAFYPQWDLAGALLFIASASFIVALPAVPGNVGPYEGAIIVAMGALGYTETPQGLAVTTAFALVVHATNLGVNAVLGIIGMLAEGVTLGQIAQRAETAVQTPENHDRT